MEIDDMENSQLDVIIIGSGISGINMAYRLQTGLPNLSYAVLEGRSEIGGTWSLFKYPGIRSDADLYNFGFSWEPWKEERTLADAPTIMKYLRNTVQKHGIDKHIKFQHKVIEVDWSSKAQQWRVKVLVNETEEKILFSRFLIFGTGYYDYNEALKSNIAGIDNFKGTVIHPQFWPENFDYSGKKVVVVGSGATAATIVPAIHEKASHITMLQRSPSYFIALPAKSSLDASLRRLLPEGWAAKLIRLRYMMVAHLLTFICGIFPNTSRKMLRSQTESLLPNNIPYDPHFSPSYRPWQQRMCITPGGDFFEALRSGKADVVTDRITTVTDHCIKLKSGRELDADVIVTATGLKMHFNGGTRLFVDGKEHIFGDKHIWRGTLPQDLPNFAFIFGYTDAAWTLGADASSLLIVRLLRNLDKRDMTSLTPRIQDPQSVKEVAWMNINSSYVKAAIERGTLPKGGDVGPWKPRISYFRDLMHAKWGDITTDLDYSRVR